jgi:pimeloyl-ACP methyl ester carboxylesterase
MSAQRDTRPKVILLVLFPVALVFCLSLYRNHVESKPAGPSPRHSVRTLPSAILSKASGKPREHQFSLVLPSVDIPPDGKKYPLVVHIPAFGEDHRLSKGSLKRLFQLMDLRPELRAIHVFVNPNGVRGHHYFVDSPFNGPVGTALTTELLPELQRMLPVSKVVVTGHSSGGWSALWLQLEYPQFFAGVWATAPDPVDFRNFYGVDLSHQMQQNLYLSSDGTQRKAMRGKSMSMKKFVQEEEEEDPIANEWAAAEGSFSPLDPIGEPQKLFDRHTGEILSPVGVSWMRYDLRSKLLSILQSRRGEIEGKIHMYCGDFDEYFLDAPFRLFCQELKNQGVQSHCELIHGKSHNSVYEPTPANPDGLVLQIWQEIAR